MSNQAEVNARGIALVRAAMNRSGRTLPALRTALEDALAVRDAYAAGLDRALSEAKRAEAAGPAAILYAGGRVYAAIAQLQAAQAKANHLAAEAEALAEGLVGHE